MAINAFRGVIFFSLDEAGARSFLSKRYQAKTARGVCQATTRGLDAETALAHLALFAAE
jgi:hypothetical protein